MMRPSLLLKRSPSVTCAALATFALETEQRRQQELLQRRLASLIAADEDLHVVAERQAPIHQTAESLDVCLDQSHGFAIAHLLCALCGQQSLVDSLAF